MEDEDEENLLPDETQARLGSWQGWGWTLLETIFFGFCDATGVAAPMSVKASDWPGKGRLRPSDERRCHRAVIFCRAWTLVIVDYLGSWVIYGIYGFCWVFGNII